MWLLPQIAISETGAMTSQLSLNTYFSLIKLLSTCVRGCPDVAKTLLSAGVLETLRQLLATSSMLASGGAGPASSSVVRTTEQLHGVMLLVTELLPAIPDAPSALQKGLPLTQGEGAAPEAACERSKMLAEDAPLLARFSSQLLPLLLQVYASTVMPQVRYLSLGNRQLFTILSHLTTSCHFSLILNCALHLPTCAFLTNLCISNQPDLCFPLCAGSPCLPDRHLQGAVRVHPGHAGGGHPRPARQQLHWRPAGQP